MPAAARSCRRGCRKTGFITTPSITLLTYWRRFFRIARGYMACENVRCCGRSERRRQAFTTPSITLLTYWRRFFRIARDSRPVKRTLLLLLLGLPVLLPHAAWAMRCGT